MLTSKIVIVVAVLAALTLKVVIAVLLSNSGVITSGVSSGISIVAAIVAIGILFTLFIRKQNRL